ncbi:hypothetical protein [Vibrio phage R01]|nr:hypothetical protein [Vibrio phage R01]
MFGTLLRYGGTLLKGVSAFWNRYKLLIILSVALGAIYRAYSIGYDLGSTYERQKATTAILDATNKAREEELSYYRDQIARLSEKHRKELELEKNNVKIQTVIETKWLTKTPVCEISKTDPEQFVFSNEYVGLYNDAVRAANRATQEGHPTGVTKTLPTNEDRGE